VFLDDDVADFKSIFRLEDAEKEFRAKLVEAVPGVVIAHREDEDTTARFNHIHAIRNGYREIKNVLERTTVDYHIVFFIILGVNRLVHIVDDSTPFIFAVVDG